MRTKLIFLTVLLSSCSYLHVPALSPYKMEIRQGNLITAEMRDKLKLGMTKAQVRYVLGTPMISDAFHGNRWDYAYRLAQQGELVEKKHLAVYFEGDNLARVEEDGKQLQMKPLVDPAPTVSEPAENAVATQTTAKTDPAAEVLSSVQAWVAAWSSKNVREYLGAYTPDFAPQNMSHDAWEKQRMDRISKPKVIEVTLNNTNVSVQDDSHATVSFMQSYRSDAYRDEVEKTLHMVKQGDRWLIAEERAGKKTGK
jgi:outer membrane protein assembly factor BamE